MTERSMLPQRRPSETFAIRHGGHNNANDPDRT
jgi:hypothetical protein